MRSDVLRIRYQCRRDGVWMRCTATTQVSSAPTTHFSDRGSTHKLPFSAALIPMVSRGSSIHHTRRTTNPFMTTSSGIVGIDLSEKVVFDAPRLLSPYESSNQASSSHNPLTAFMYQTTSRQLGDGVRAHERSKLSQRMDKLTVQRELEDKGLVKVRSVDVVAPHDCALSPEDVIPQSIDTRAISEPRQEHPLYATSTREVGMEKAQLRVDVERLGRPNSFTQSFNGFRYRDFGLNTAITRSKICDQLDTA